MTQTKKIQNQTITNQFYCFYHLATIVHAKTHEKTHAHDLDSCKTQEHKKTTNATQKDK
jgi:hypothetical protein